MAAVTLIVSNHSARQNAIVEWSATVKNSAGEECVLDMMQSTMGEGPDDPHIETYNATPLLLPSFSAVEARLVFHVNERTLPNPIVIDLVAKDRMQKTHPVSISIANVVKSTMSQAARYTLQGFSSNKKESED